MGYQWNFADTADCVMAGGRVGREIVWGEVIQRADGLGGYNVEVQVSNFGGCYHIHFLAGTRQVNCLRYKRSNIDIVGDNICVFSANGGEPTNRRNLRNLGYWCEQQGYDNHARLLRKIAEVVNDNL
ncbi:MAG TPA: hypothetical protein VHY08_09345 [Bacillota bacterium]|nr:hypothetical protein [Bacillota bacterium]